MSLKFAIPVKDGKLFEHFGRADEYCLVEVKGQEIISSKSFPGPLHDRGMIPAWLAENKVTHVLADCIGQAAIEILNDYKIEVLWGIPHDAPELLVKAFLDSQLSSGINLCDH